MTDEGDQASIADVDALLQRLLKYTEESWGKATAYDTAITVAGYGAFFALWSGVAKDITPVSRDVTVALMGVSLLLYISWHITLMLARHWHDRALIDVTNAGHPPAKMIEEWSKVEDRQRATLLSIQGRLWMPVFGLAVLTGVGGALTLIYNCVAAAVSLPQLTG